MADAGDPIALKNLLSPLLLGITGVSGLGVPSGRLTVYLASDDAALRRRVQEVVDKHAPGATPAFVVTGSFRAH